MTFAGKSLKEWMEPWTARWRTTTGLPLALDAKSDSLIASTALEMTSAAHITCFRDITGGESGPDSSDKPGAGPVVLLIRTQMEIPGNPVP